MAMSVSLPLWKNKLQLDWLAKWPELQKAGDFGVTLQTFLSYTQTPSYKDDLDVNLFPDVPFDLRSFLYHI